MQKKVFAVVVTYNRADVLKKSLESIIGQSGKKIDHLYIVVNSKDIETLDVIQEYSYEYPGLISHDLYDNVGPAGGFYYGIKKFTESGYDYVWLMDDDIFPDPSCLENLVSKTNKHSFIYPTVLKPSGETVEAFGWWGVLISREVVQEAGMPLKELFYWIEDTEYLQNRIHWKNKIEVYRSTEARVLHLHKRALKRPDWYYYYVMRNTLHYRFRYFSLNKRSLIRVTYLFVNMVYKILIIESNKTRKFKNLLLGIKDAFNGSLGKQDRLH